MKKLFTLLLLVVSAFVSAQKISTIDFVQVQNNNHDEAIFYYENNWLKLREMAVERGYITSFELIEVKPTSEAPFDLILMTTYPDMKAYEKAEENFGLLIKERGNLKLMNEKKPGEFRKILFSKMDGRHLNE